MPAHGDITSGIIDDAGRRVGQRIRELRQGQGVKQRDLAALMVDAGHTVWDTDTVSAVETGRVRRLSYVELVSLADVLGVTVDGILRPAVGPEARAKPIPPLPSGRRIGDPATTPGLDARNQSKRLGYVPWPGQEDRLERLAARKGWAKAHAQRHCTEVGLRAYEEETT